MATLKWYDEKTLVVKTADRERFKQFFEALGLKFQEEQHGKGPIHYACQVGEHVLEIYPEGQKS